MIEKDKDLLRKNLLFSGMSERELEFALTFYGAKEKKYKAGTTILKIGSPMTAFGIVLSGVVQVYADDADGVQMIMATNSAGDSFGESLAFLKTPEIPVYIIAIEDCRVLWLSFERIINPASGMCNHEYMNRVITCFAKRALKMNDRIQVLSKRSLRQKLFTLLSQYQQKSGARTFDIPLSREDMAVYLGCDRSALSRELSNMKKDGIIDYYRNSFRLLSDTAKTNE